MLSATRASRFVPYLFVVLFWVHSYIFPSDETDGDKKKKDKKKKKGEKEEKEKKKGPSKATVKAMQEALAKMKEVWHAGKSIHPL